jgi:hypothetical protein
VVSIVKGISGGLVLSKTNHFKNKGIVRFRNIRLNVDLSV